MSNVSFIMHNRADVGLKAAADALADRGLQVDPLGDSLAVQWTTGDGPTLRIDSQQGPDCQEEHAEIGDGREAQEELSSCSARFEISFDDIDEVLDEINTLIEVQATLQDLTHGYLFNLWNGHLSGPEE